MSNSFSSGIIYSKIVLTPIILLPLINTDQELGSVLLHLDSMAGTNMLVDVIRVQQHLHSAEATLVVIHWLNHVPTVIAMQGTVLLDGDHVHLLGVLPHVVQFGHLLADLADDLASIGHVVAVQSNIFYINFIKFQILDQMFEELRRFICNFVF